VKKKGRTEKSGQPLLHNLFNSPWPNREKSVLISPQETVTLEKKMENQTPEKSIERGEQIEATLIGSVLQETRRPQQTQ